ncbi:TVP38/TMEM64 family protein [Bacillus sp. BHET2]|uniref:TVP38/TMEM64 family protein n=1 Tax=Bacillus sp. BHET2 TaxID=2583818 RepID=UPI00110EECDE|nr:VTT domain-containing protein [Bacillus sp. BHET2]TMU87539.1 TVP38/TMEM64 family protein [Bacillus sp. BHET2]
MSTYLQHFTDDLIGLNIGFLFIISITISIVISILGFLPSIFLTAFNISVFGLWAGIAISIVGESLGAIISFFLFRKGMQLAGVDRILTNKYFLKLKESSGKEWILLLFFFRIVPFVPSSVVTIAAAFSSISIFSFTAISSLGKIPSLLIEAFIVANLLDSKNGNGLLMLGAIVVGLVYFLYRLKNKRK